MADLSQKTQKSNGEIRKYLFLFFAIVIIFYLASELPWFDAIRRPVLYAFATISAGILSLFGYGTSANLDIISSPQFSVSIKEGCDALAPIFFYSVAILAYPVDLSKRLKGVAIGIFSLLVLNIIRICSLFLIGLYLPSWFDFMHVDFWQVLFIILTGVCWIIWSNWAHKKNVSDEK